MSAEHGTVAGYREHRRNREPACQPCKTAETAERRERKARDAESVELTGGRWVNVRGVMRWRPDMPQLQVVPDRPDVVCDCGAKANESCRTKNGQRTRDHDYRLSPRLCRNCDSAPKPRSTYCAPCREQLRRKQKGLKTMTPGPAAPSHLSLVAVTIEGEGTAQKSAPERRANASAQGPRQPAMKGLTDSCSA